VSERLVHTTEKVFSGTFAPRFPEKNSERK
jgi:hypothetical protein